MNWLALWHGWSSSGVGTSDRGHDGDSDGLGEEHGDDVGCCGGFEGIGEECWRLMFGMFDEVLLLLVEGVSWLGEELDGGVRCGRTYRSGSTHGQSPACRRAHRCKLKSVAIWRPSFETGDIENPPTNTHQGVYATANALFANVRSIP